MPFRPSWVYGDHPPTCTCARCVRARRENDYGWPYYPVQRNKTRRKLVWLLIVLTITTIVLVPIAWDRWGDGRPLTEVISSEWGGLFTDERVRDEPSGSRTADSTTPTEASTSVPTATATPNYPGGIALAADEIEIWVIQFTNVVREENGLAPLIPNADVSSIAREHSHNMARLNLLEHEIAGKDPSDRALDAGYTCRAYRADGSYTYGLSENIYEHPRVTYWSGTTSMGISQWRPTTYSRDSRAMAQNLVDGWMDSPGHRENILNPYNRRIGVGVAIGAEEEYGYISETVFATQNFSQCE